MHPFKRIKISNTGDQLPESATEFAAVLFPELGIMAAAASIGVSGKPAEQDKPGPQANIEAACKKLQLAGFDDWQLADDFQGQLPVDRSRDPCIDQEFFPGVPARWHWTSTPCPWSSASAFGVGFYGGGVGGVLNDHRGHDGFGLPVRVVGQ